MPKNKMIKKVCPKCEQQLPVACKACPCGHNFFLARQQLLSLQKNVKEKDIIIEGKRRRTERVRRGKPNYYDSLEYEKQQKKHLKKRNKMQRRHKSSTTSTDDRDDGKRGDEDYEDDDEIEVKVKRKRKPRSERREEEEDVIANSCLEKGLQYSIILAELNRKILLSSWRG